MTSADPSAPAHTAAATEPGPAAEAGKLARWDVSTLCGEAGEAILVHNGEHYRLRVTARGRLILTK